MTPTIRTRPTRPGFTLVELLVAMALSLGIMVILTEAFKISLDFTRSANSTKILIIQLRSAGAVLTRDMQAENFLAEDGKPNRGVKLSDQWIDRLDTTSGLGWTQPKGGFFKLRSTRLNQVLAAVADYDGFSINSAAPMIDPTTRLMVDPGHVLHFTAIWPGGTEQNLFVVQSGGNVYTSRAAEVAYFLVPIYVNPSNPASGQVMTAEDKDAAGNILPGQPLYNLIRRYRLVAATEDDLPALDFASNPGGTPDPETISYNGTIPNTLATVAKAANRMTLAQLPSSSARYGEDILLSNVMSFMVLPQWDKNSPASSASSTSIPTIGLAPRPFGITSAKNSNHPFDSLQDAMPSSTGLFDTSPTTDGDLKTIQQPIRIRSIQVTLRIYDPNLKQSRQNTWTFAK